MLKASSVKNSAKLADPLDAERFPVSVTGGFSGRENPTGTENSRKIQTKAPPRVNKKSGNDKDDSEEDIISLKSYIYDRDQAKALDFTQEVRWPTTCNIRLRTKDLYAIDRPKYVIFRHVGGYKLYSGQKMDKKMLGYTVDTHDFLCFDEPTQ